MLKSRVGYKQHSIVFTIIHIRDGIRHNRIEKIPLVYLDETWANTHDRKSGAWVKDE